MRFRFVVFFASAVALPGLVAGSLLSEIATGIENASDCASCHALLIPLQTLAHLGNDAFVDTMVTICDTFKVRIAQSATICTRGSCVSTQLEDPDVCAGAIGQQGPILAHSLRGMSTTGSTATKFCEALFGLCQEPAPTPYTMPMPARRKPARPVPSCGGKAPFQVIHFSDVHIDRQYTPGSEANCTKLICCRKFADQVNETTTEPAGPNGNSKCDSPVTLADSMLEAAQHFGAHAKFSIFTGDVVEGEPHCSFLSQ